MDFKSGERKAILSKSLAIIEKTKSKLEQLDSKQFPSPSSINAVNLLLDSLSILENPKIIDRRDPEVLYENLFNIQKLVDMLSQSSCDRISWPIVNYCDDIWKTLFSSKNIQIFYSLTSEHNYQIRNYSKAVAWYLRDLLTKDESTSLFSDVNIYCLELASTEDANLPLYANIGHEFGHAVHDQHDQQIYEQLDEAFKHLIPNIYGDLAKIDIIQAYRRFKRISRVLMRASEELFCDLFGTTMMGPAFCLSLYEMSWERRKEMWYVVLPPDDELISAYPSFHFRLQAACKSADIASFCESAKKDFDFSDSEFSHLSESLNTLPTDSTKDKISIQPAMWLAFNKDAEAIDKVMTTYLTEIKDAFEVFLLKCKELIDAWYKLNSSFNTENIAQLLLRLQHNILPNIVPSKSEPLLGKRAELSEILNATALSRLDLLVNDKNLSAPELSRRTGIVERLAGKALEVSYIQNDFNTWKRNIERTK